MNSAFQMPSFQVWIALKDIEEYIRNGIVVQMNNASSFGGEDMTLLREKYFIIERLKPVLSASVYQNSLEVLQVAVDGLNKMLNDMRQALASNSESRREQARAACDSARKIALEKYKSALDHIEPLIGKDEINSSSKVTHIRIDNNSGIINVQSTLDSVSQSISKADSLNGEEKKKLTELFFEFTRSLEVVSPAHIEAAEIASDQAKDLAKELEKPVLRKNALQIKGAGLIEAAKALSVVVPMASAIAKQIVDYINSKI